MINLEAAVQMFNAIIDPSVLRVVVGTLLRILGVLSASAGVALLFIFNLKPKFYSVFDRIFYWFWVLPSFFLIALVWIVLKLAHLDGFLYDWPAIYLAWFLGIVPLMVWGGVQGLKRVDQNQIKVAQTLGATSAQAFYRVTLPAIVPFLTYTGMQCFYILMTSFSLVMILGGGSPRDTLETRIYQEWFFQMRTGVWSYELFAFLIWQSAFLVLVQGVGVKITSKVPVSVFQVSLEKKVFQKTTLWWCCFLVLWALIGKTKLWMPVAQTLILGTCVALGVVAFIFLIYKTKFKSIVWWGSWVSPIVVAWLVWEGTRMVGWNSQEWVSSMTKAAFVQIVLFLPWASRILFPVLAQVKIHELKMAHTLGATNFQAWQSIEWHRLRPIVFDVLLLMGIFSISEVGSVILFSNENFEPLTLWIQNQYGRFQIQAALTGTVILMGSAGLLITRRVS